MEKVVSNTNDFVRNTNEFCLYDMTVYYGSKSHTGGSPKCALKMLSFAGSVYLSYYTPNIGGNSCIEKHRKHETDMTCRILLLWLFTLCHFFVPDLAQYLGMS